MSDRLVHFLNSDVSDCTGGRLPSKSGDLFGVELECEGVNVDYAGGGGIKGWTPHDDGSLRKHHGSSCEWVFSSPASYNASVLLIGKLFEYFKTRKAKLVCSNRTSLHVHYNMGDKANYQLVNLYVLFTILEGILDRYCGEDREGNLFCLSSRYASEQVRWVEESCFQYYNYSHIREQNRYCSFNMAALNKFNSVEFRGMRGLDNQEDILAWLSILNELTQFACYTMTTPVKVLEDISQMSPTGFLKTVFSKDNYARLTEGLSAQDVSTSMYEGLRLVQRIVYRVGAVFGEVKLRKKDFWQEAGKNIKPNIEDTIMDAAEELPRANPFLRPRNAAAFRERNPAAEIPMPRVNLRQDADALLAGLRDVRDVHRFRIRQDAEMPNELQWEQPILPRENPEEGNF